MTLVPKLNRAHLAAAVGVILAAACGLVLHEFRLGAGLVRSSYDLLHVWRGDQPVTEAVVVCLDEESHRKLGQPLNAPWDRSIHARLVDRLTGAGARAIVFDIVFSDPNSNHPAADARLAAAIKASGRVVLAADNVRVGPGEKQIIPPFDLLRDAAAGMGSDELVPDSDLVVRQHTPRGDNPLSSLSWVAAGLAGAKVAKDDRLEDVPRWMNYYGPPNFIPWVSYADALDPAATRDEFFRGKTVFVGARLQTKFAGDRKDEYANPFSFWLSKKMAEQQEALFSPGVEIQATAFLNLLRGDWLKRIAFGTERLLLLAAGLVFGWGLVQFRPIWATGVAIVCLGAVAWSAYLGFVHGLVWFPWLLVAAQITLALAWSVLFNSVQLYVEKRLYLQTLRFYLPPKLVKKFAGSRDLLKPGATQQTLTLFFSDIADFTTIAEGMDPDELAGLMNHYFDNAIAKCIHKADGTVAKYIGDAIFAFWNAPDPHEDHALLACEAALLFREQTAQPIRGRTLHTRIGLHTGVANVGNFGSVERVDYTALGESVNLASRLEGLNKHLGTDCLLSGATKDAVGERMLTRPLGSFQLKGFAGLVAVYELIGRPDADEATRPWRQAFAEALNTFEHRDLELAVLGFRQVLELRPNDGPSQFYLKRIADLAKETLPDNWATYTILREK
ncbi:MAG TPA: adenylate/guanylate cyclase domain-containing protein [Candidatus Binatia bacterium]|nr:adenylate/guanylate cyclase domain-containing protein [Candidatus Binatia bacterium]